MDTNGLKMQDTKEQDTGKSGRFSPNELGYVRQKLEITSFPRPGVGGSALSLGGLVEREGEFHDLFLIHYHQFGNSFWFGTILGLVYGGKIS